MIKFLLAIILVVGSTANLARKDCLFKLSSTVSEIKQAMNMELTNTKIDTITQIINEMPSTISECLGQQAQMKFKTQIPSACVADLNKAAKIGLRLQNQKQNQLLFSRDLILLEKHFQTKIKKSCPFTTQMTLKDIKDAATCMQASYKFSLIVQKLSGDVQKYDKKAILADVDNIFVTLPSVLDTCGKNDWADEVRKYLPMNCIHAVEDLVAQIAVTQHHYSHFQWLVKNYKDIEAYVSMVRMHCPFVY